jgi:hypothetical protein
MKRRVIQLKESELKQLISRIIEEQTAASAFTQGQQAGQVAGQQARQVVNKAANQAVTAVKQGANTVIKGVTETIVTFAKVTFKIVIYGAAVVFVIGQSIFKVGAAIGNAIIKFIASTGQAAIKSGQAIAQDTVAAFRKAGIALEKGAQWVGQQLSALKDSTLAVGKYLIDHARSLGTAAYAKFLVAMAGIKELGTTFGNYLKNGWASIQNSIGVAWENASSWASGVYNKAKQGLSDVGTAIGNKARQVGTAIGDKANQIAQGVSNFAGKALGGIQGFLQEMYERYLSFSDDSKSILNEAVHYNGKVIL